MIVPDNLTVARYIHCAANFETDIMDLLSSRACKKCRLLTDVSRDYVL